MRRRGIQFALLSFATAFAPLTTRATEPSQPSRASGHEETRQVHLRDQVEAPCLAYPAGRAVVLLPRRELEELAHSDTTHLDQLHGQRARTLLDSELSDEELRGCASVKSTPPGASYLLLRQIELGAAAVMYADGEDFLPYISLRYSSDSTGGFITLLNPDRSRALYSWPWWIR